MNNTTSNTPEGGHVMRASALVGLPVVGIDSGEDLAEIRDVVYDASKHRLIGFTLNKRGTFAGRLQDVLPSAAIAAIGADAVMVENEEKITGSGTPGALDDTGDAASVLGNRVIAATGTDLGEVVGVIVSTGAGGEGPEAVGYEIDPTNADGDKMEDRVFVPISAQMAVSGENLMLPEEATEFVRNDLSGFGAAVAAYRKTTIDRGNS